MFHIYFTYASVAQAQGPPARVPSLPQAGKPVSTTRQGRTIGAWSPRRDALFREMSGSPYGSRVLGAVAPDCDRAGGSQADDVQERERAPTAEVGALGVALWG
jgi:hypothetical protein